MSMLPIADHALLSDCHSAALVSRAGSVEWLSFPRFDSPSIFGRLLDDDAGHWSITPAGQFEATRRYADRTMVLETTFSTPSGTAVLTDALAIGPDNTGHELGKGAPRLLIRSRDGGRGRGHVRRLVRAATRIRAAVPAARRRARRGDGTGRRGVAGAIDPGDAGHRRVDGVRQCHRLPPARRSSFGLHRSTLEQQPAHVWSQDELHARLEATVAGWQSWSELHQNYAGPWAELVHHSGRVLQALTYQPSGAIVAAATTSLPEGHRRRAQLGLPLHLGAGRVVHDGRVVGRRLPRRGERFLRLPRDGGGRVARQRRPAADHVRGRRRARPVRADVAASDGVEEQRPGARRQRRLEPAASRCLRRAARRRTPAARPDRRHRRRHPRVPHRLRGRRDGSLARAGPGHLGGAR